MKGRLQVPFPNYTLNAFLMKREFLKGQDNLQSQLALFQIVNGGTGIALSGTVFEREIDDAKDRARPRPVRLSGEFRSEYIDQVKAEMVRESPSVLELEEVDLVDVEVIRFVNSCEAAGVSVLHASAYIRAWVSQERVRPAHQGRRRKGQ